MYGPVPALLYRKPQGSKPGLSGVEAPCASGHGFCVKYRRVGQVRYQSMAGTTEAIENWEAVVELLVQDLSSDVAYCKWVTFLLDTGSDMTIVPRNFVHKNAFPFEKRVGLVPLLGLTGRAVTAGVFEACLSLVSPRRGTPGLTFRMPILVPEEWYGKHAVLGLDVLRRIHIVSDREFFSIWPEPCGHCPGSAKKTDVLLT